jgi:hypothetical protein
MAQTWILTYDDGEGDGFREEVVEGKLSLDPMWAMVIDQHRVPTAIILAVPTFRVIDIREVQAEEA